MSQIGKFLSINAPICFLSGDVGGFVPGDATENVNIVGAAGITVTGTPLTSTLTIGFGAGVVVPHAVLVGSALGAISSLPLATTGQALIGSTGNDPAWTGNPSIAGTVTAGTGFIATTGDITATVGNVVTTAGSIKVGNLAAAATASDVDFLKSRTGAVIITGDTLGNITFQGHDGTQYIQGAAIISNSTGTIAATRVGGTLEFYTHPDAALALPSLPRQRMIINEEGTVTINAPDGGNAITALGGDVYLEEGSVFVGDATAAATASTVTFDKSRTGGVITTGDVLGTVIFKGHDGTNFETGAQIEAVSTGTIAATRIPTILKFYTHPDSPAANPSERMVISEDGGVTINTPDAGSALTLVGNDLELYQGNVFVGDALAAATASQIALAKSRTGGIITTGDTLGTMLFQGHDGVSYNDSAKIVSVSSGTIGVGNVPANIEFWTKPDSVNPITKRMDISPAGNVTIAAPDAGVALTITAGGLTVTAGTTTLTPLGGGMYAGLVTASTTGVLTAISNTANDGYVLISKADGSNPVWNGLTAGTGISITRGANSITIADTIGVTWSEATADVNPAAVQNGYIANKAGTACTITLPALSAIGTTIDIVGKGATGWIIAQGAGQQILFGTTATTIGAGGSLASSSTNDCVSLLCTTANTTWTVKSSIGNLTVS